MNDTPQEKWAREVLAGEWRILGDPDENGERHVITLTVDSPELERIYPRSVFVSHRAALDRLIELEGRL